MTQMLQNPTTVTTNYLAISAGTLGNRRPCLHVSRVQGGGNAALPTSVTIGGQVATKQGGFPDGSFSRLTEAVYALTEAQIPLMVGVAIVLTGGNFGGQLLTAFVLEDCVQTTPVNSGYVHNPVAVTSGNISLTRAAGSLTYYGILIPTLTTPTMVNPSADGNQTGSGAQMTYGWQLEASAGTSNCSYTSSSQLSGQIAINFPSPQPTIVSIGSQTEDFTFPDAATGITTSTDNMGEVVAGSMYGRPINVQLAIGDSANIDFPQREDGMTWLPTLPFGVTLTLADADDNEAQAPVTLTLNDGDLEKIVEFAGASTTDVGTVSYYLSQLGYSVADGVQLIYPGYNRTIYPDGSMVSSTLDAFSVWHIDPDAEWNGFGVEPVTSVVVDITRTIKKLASLKFAAKKISAKKISSKIM